jgi:hypothetical protein
MYHLRSSREAGRTDFAGAAASGAASARSEGFELVTVSPDRDHEHAAPSRLTCRAGRVSLCRGSEACPDRLTPCPDKHATIRLRVHNGVRG